MGNFAIIDIETSGFSHTVNGLCQVAGKVVTPNFELVASIDLYVKPYGKVYTKQAFEIHGLSEEFLQEHGETVHVVLDQFRLFLLENNVTYIVGHNVIFDRRFLIEELKILSQWDSLRFAQLHIKDTAKMKWHIINRTLENLCKFYCIPYSGKHNAMEDVESTLKLFKYRTLNPDKFR